MVVVSSIIVVVIFTAQALVSGQRPNATFPEAVNYASPNDNTINGRPLRLVFEDEFNGGELDRSKWKQEITMWGGGNGEFNAYTNSRKNTYVRDGTLFIRPTPTADVKGESFLWNGVWDMRQEFGECTMPADNGCWRQGRDGILPPIMSGKIMSHGAIRYGKVEIVAKAPKGDWLWPALWMLPKDSVYGQWPRSGEIDIMETTGNVWFGQIGNEYHQTTLHWGSEPSQNRHAMTHAKAKANSGSLADRFYKYTLLWDRSGMDIFLDNQHIKRFNTPSQGYWRWGNLPGNPLWKTNEAPFDQYFFLILNVAVGGNAGFIPDGVPNKNGNKPWSNNQGKQSAVNFWNGRGQWLHTWNGEEAALQVKSVRMWQLD